jgi:hypothetical protein
MKNHLLFWLLIILVGLVISGGTSQNASANSREQYPGIRQSASDQLAAQTPIPTDSPSIALTATAESRVLPPVGSNAGLVIGASVLVLIIIGGVLGSQWKKKH